MLAAVLLTHLWLMGPFHLAGEWAVIAQGAYAAAPLQAALPNVDVYPLLGPMGGGTEVVLEVRCSLHEHVACATAAIHLTDLAGLQHM